MMKPVISPVGSKSARSPSVSFRWLGQVKTIENRLNPTCDHGFARALSCNKRDDNMITVARVSCSRTGSNCSQERTRLVPGYLRTVTREYSG